MTVMTVAAPGEVPQIAVLPEKSPDLDSNQPNTAAATTVNRAPLRKIGQWTETCDKMVTGSCPAIMIPTKA